MLLLEKNRKTREKLKKKKKNRYFTEIEPYLYKFDATESHFGIYTRKTKESLFEI
jgi:ribosomal protein L21E